MKAVTEFWIPKLAEGNKAKAAFAAEGKTPEEISAAIGEKFKFEGDKLKAFVAAMDIASQTTEKILLIKVVRLNEGQNPPPRGTVVEDLCYITELQPDPATAKKVEVKMTSNRDGGGRGKGGKGGGKQGGKGGGKPKESPWGMSPEEKEAKLAAARNAAREKSLAGKS